MFREGNAQKVVCVKTERGALRRWCVLRRCVCDKRGDSAQKVVCVKREESAQKVVCVKRGALRKRCVLR